MRDAVHRKRGKFRARRDSIEHDKEDITRLRTYDWLLAPSRRSAEIDYDLALRIADGEDRIRSKERKLGELEEAISDIESKV
jgi:uncharacterized protein (DUF3084 family)